MKYTTEEGFPVIITDINEEKLEEVSEKYGVLEIVIGDRYMIWIWIYILPSIRCYFKY